ncbi:G-type lectin S-receptor-like serine/threonine-protein kinase At4g03230 [Corylus avellana]|uniref:G-type lectin S-receptor-like serine/threonine-protein kinase At4g03230 n=1 Tax=Corylus avellana TaxID=13451 RepID=UPI00286D5378|nr:G-type lectin S-receptor-like serine/threonine-protein kinase At4g03230 [Corylus avellana]
MMVSHRRKANCTILSASWLLSSILFSYILLLFSCRVDYCYAMARDTLKQGEWITDNGTTLVSSGETFELGFFTPIRSSSHKRFVGIWYKQDQQTVVWVANRDRPVLNGSIGTFGIAEDGNLKISDINTGNVYWSVGDESFGSTRRSVKLMDSGNLVLRDDQFATSLWKSFQYPTDTFLSGMKMDQELMLTSWIGDGDPGNGNFTFKQYQDEEGHYVISKKTGDYWRSWMSGNFLSSDEMPYAIANLLSNFSKSVPQQKRSAQLQLDFNYTGLVMNYSYTRLVMNYNGELQYLNWDVGMGNWDLIWWKPKDECSIYNVCGKFGSCNINNRPFVCKCLPGFQPTNQTHWDSRDFLDGCIRSSTSSDNNDMFLILKMMKASNPDSDFKVKNETECRNECLGNSQCQAYSYEVAQNSSVRSETTAGTDTCWIWNSDLKNLQEEYTNGGRDLSVRVAKSVIESTVRNCDPCGTNPIPYPLSTGPNCGDPMYFYFYCDNSTGQVSFKTPSGTFRVVSIDPSTRKFVIQVKNARYDINSKEILQLNESLPFNKTNDSGNYNFEVKDEEKISWEPPKEPTCTLSTGCKDWPNSTCKVARDGQSRCLCTENYLWNGSNINCTKEGHLPPSLEEPSKRKKAGLPLSVVVSLISVFGLTCTISTCVFVWRKMMAKKEENRRREERNRVLRPLDHERHLKDLMGSSEFKEDEKDIDVPFFDLESILLATNRFSDANKLGQGGYGPVYKGIFPGGQEIAVKRLSSVSGQGLQEFKNEVVLIAKLQHRNLVRLLGYCIKGDEKILLYEYMPNKSLDSFIFDQKLSMCLDWEMRINIISGIARGLVYLHHDSRLRIIHRDLKTSNILLDEEMNPKISDFGLARIVGGKETGANTTRVVGTYGYMSPEYVIDGLFSVKSDVFSFGVVLLEIISGKKNTGFYQSELARSLIGYAWRLWGENKVLDLVDPALHEVCNANEFVKCVNIGLLCVQEDPNDRPTISNVIAMLDNEAATIPTPKHPAFVPWRGLSSQATSSSKPDTYTESTSSL